MATDDMTIKVAVADMPQVKAVMEEAAATNAALRAENEKLRRELRWLEWYRHDPRLSESSCPSCHGIRNLHGHAPNCRIAALLGESR